MRIYFAGSLGKRRRWIDALYDVGLRHRLLAYVADGALFEIECEEERMRIYLAGVQGGSVQAQAALPPHRRLFSKEDTALQAGLDAYVGKRVDLFLDSGAFTAWTKGVTIDLDAYADFVLAHKDVFSVVANLDVIPGAPGTSPTPKDIDRAAAQGWENYEYLRKRFADAPFTLLHAYHRGEDVKWLKKIMDREEYFAFGGIAVPGLTTKAKTEFIDGVMPLLTDDQGWPIRKLHGFGVAGIPLMQRYPWFSVDSTSWLVATRFGGCYVPPWNQVVTFSSDSPKRSEDGAHFTTFTAPEQAAIRAYVEGKGYTIEELAADYIKRSELNVIFFLDLERGWTDQPWKRQAAQRSFF